ncbi:MAG: hypothetical protein ACHQT7_02800, partial [Candidatus Levyibacteriota bacterium]
MTNWAERVEQERRRLAVEEASKKQAADARARQITQEAERIRKEQEAKILQNLQFFNRLGVDKTLREIDRDVCKGNGTIESKAPHFEGHYGDVGCELVVPLRSWYFDTERVTIGGTSGNKIIGVKFSTSKHRIGISMRYGLGSDTKPNGAYSLYSGCGNLEFIDPVAQRGEIDQFLEKSFLATAVEARGIMDQDARKYEVSRSMWLRVGY